MRKIFGQSIRDSARLQKRYAFIASILTWLTVLLGLASMVAVIYMTRKAFGLPMGSMPLKGNYLRFLGWLGSMFVGIPAAFYLSMVVVHGVFCIVLMVLGQLTFSEAGSITLRARFPERWLKPYKPDEGDSEGDGPDQEFVERVDRELRTVERRSDNTLLLVLVILTPLALWYGKSGWKSAWIDMLLIVLIIGAIVFTILSVIIRKKNVAIKLGLACPRCKYIPKPYLMILTATSGKCLSCGKRLRVQDGGL